MTILASASSAPVLPAETRPLASPARHRVDREAHRGVAQAQSHRGLHIPGDGLARMADGAGGAGARMRRQKRRQLRFVADEQEAAAGMALGRQRQAGDHHGRGIVPTHRIDSQGKWRPRLAASVMPCRG